MKIHPRQHLVDGVRIEVQKAVLAAVEKRPLTAAEIAYVLAEIQWRWAGTALLEERRAAKEGA